MNPSDVDIRSEVRDMLTRLKHRARVAIAREDATASCPKLRRSKRTRVPIKRLVQELAQQEAIEEPKPKKSRRFDPTQPPREPPRTREPTKQHRNAPARVVARESSPPRSTFICSQCSREYTQRAANRGKRRSIARTCYHRRRANRDAMSTRRVKRISRQRTDSRQQKQQRIITTLQCHKNTKTSCVPRGRVCTHCDKVFTKRNVWRAHRRDAHPKWVGSRWHKQQFVNATSSRVAKVSRKAPSTRSSPNVPFQCT